MKESIFFQVLKYMYTLAFASSVDHTFTTYTLSRQHKRYGEKYPYLNVKLILIMLNVLFAIKNVHYILVEFTI